MRLRNSLLGLVFASLSFAANPAGYTIAGGEPGAWPRILSSIGMLPSPDGLVTVALPGIAAGPAWQRRVEEGAYLIFEGDSPLAESFGFRAGGAATVASMIDTHAPDLPLILERPLEVRRFQLPPGICVFARDRWSDLPMLAGIRRGKGAVLWVAASPGLQGYERFPYLPQALADLGWKPPFRARRTWAFFDDSYRAHVDLDYFAAKWRKAGISALHVAAWHFYEPDAGRDAYLHHLVEACHRQGIQVYAWVELPHVSGKFWDDHPEWREQTAVLQDAALDWRKLMNLSNRDCSRAVSAGLRELVRRFDWDGVNLAELYFESLEGAANPARFTPLNADVRAEFRAAHGFDPVELWSTRKDAASLRLFLDYRASLALRLQEQWLTEVERFRAFRPSLDIVLTHVDDRMDTGMTDAIGADSARVFPLLKSHDFTFLVEDPATVWNLGPGRYPEIAKRYPVSPKLAIDINVVERYQDVYPTKLQTGSELLQLLHLAATAFPRVALYFENSIRDVDYGLLSAAGAVVTRYERQGEKILVDSPHGFLLPWPDRETAGVEIDGEPWAAWEDGMVNVPAGAHALRSGALVPIQLAGFNGDLHTARAFADRIEFSYTSAARSLAQFSCDVKKVTIDGAVFVPGAVGRTLLLPSGTRNAVAWCR